MVDNLHRLSRALRPTIEHARQLNAGDLSIANGNGEQLASIDAANADTSADKLLLTAPDF